MSNISDSGHDAPRCYLSLGQGNFISESLSVTNGQERKEGRKIKRHFVRIEYVIAFDIRLIVTKEGTNRVSGTSGGGSLAPVR